MKTFWILILCGHLLLACGNTGFRASEADWLEGLDSSQKAADETAQLPTDFAKEDFAYKGDLIPSNYYHPLIRDELNACKSGQFVSLRGERGVELMKVCSSTLSECAMEGSCQIARGEDVRSFNYQGLSGGRYVFFEITSGGCVYGYGVQSTCLDPFYTVAADLRYHKAGEVIYVPKVAGVVLPNGSLHSGYFIVRDGGGAIKGANRFDFYSGSLTWNDDRNPFYGLQISDPKKRFSYFRVDGETATSIRQVRAYPKLPGKRSQPQLIFTHEDVDFGAAN